MLLRILLLMIPLVMFSFKAVWSTLITLWTTEGSTQNFSLYDVKYYVLVLIYKGYAFEGFIRIGGEMEMFFLLVKVEERA